MNKDGFIFNSFKHCQQIMNKIQMATGKGYLIFLCGPELKINDCKTEKGTAFYPLSDF